MHQRLKVKNMLMIKDWELTEEEKEFVEILEKPEICLFMSPSTAHPSTKGEMFLTFTHPFVSRRGYNIEKPGEITSPLYEKCVKIFERFCVENQIPVQFILRGAINVTTHEPFLHGDIHVDHNFPHKNFLIYLNEFDEGCTYLFDDKNNITNVIVPKFGRVAIFDGVPHANGFCKPKQKRIVMIITFK
jgi:hypothetical protein